MPAGDASTRDKLLDAAARLFAERGVYAVSLAEVVRAAGQRNSSAVHYHFGTRDELLLAILERYIPLIRERRLELLERVRAAPEDDLRSAAEAVVRPVTEFAQRGWRERAYLQIGSELMGDLERGPQELRALLLRTAGYEAMVLLAQRCPPLPPEIWRERSALLLPFIGRAAADRARGMDRRRRRTGPVLSDDHFVENLMDMLIGALSAPTTAHAQPRAARRRGARTREG